MKKMLSILLSIFMVFSASSIFSSATMNVRAPYNATPEDIEEIYSQFFEKYVYLENDDILKSLKASSPLNFATMAQFFDTTIALRDVFSSVGSRQLAALFIDELLEFDNIKNATYIIVIQPDLPKHFAVIYELGGQSYVADLAKDMVKYTNEGAPKYCNINLNDYCSKFNSGTIFQLLNMPPYKIHKLESELIEGEDYFVFQPEI